jgi:thiosulfate/3-mercaptopyruvate sulfurtransferase
MPDSPLISVDDLRARLADPSLRIADVRWWLADPGKGRRDYEAAHFPGAIFVDVDRDLVGPDGPGRHPLPDPRAFAERLEQLGFEDGSDIVAYDDAGGTIAARLWWMLDDLGHPRVRVLDGGIQAWVAAGGPLTDVVPTYPPGALTLRDAWSGTIDRDALVPRLGQVALLDARAPERYRGEVELIDPVAGHIPTARSFPTGGSLGADGRFLDPAALRDRFAPLGDEVVTACGSGITACHTALAMRVAGLPDPLLYPGSYSDWSRAGMPVATGDEPGTVPRELSGG